MTFRLLLRMMTAFSIFALFALLSSFSNAQSDSGPAFGTRISDFSLRDQFGEKQKLSDLLSGGPIALVVHRSAGW